MNKFLIKQFTCTLVVIFSLTLSGSVFCDDDFSDKPFQPSITADSLKTNSDSKADYDKNDCMADFAVKSDPKPFKPSITMSDLDSAGDSGNNSTNTINNGKTSGSNSNIGPQASNGQNKTKGSSNTGTPNTFNADSVYSPENSQNQINNMVGNEFTDYTKQQNYSEKNNNKPAPPPETLDLFGVKVKDGATTSQPENGPSIKNAQALPEEVKVSISETNVNRGNTLGGKAAKYRKELLAAGIPAEDIPPLWGKGGLVEKLASYNEISNPNMVGDNDKIKLPDVLEGVGNKGEAQYNFNWERKPYLPLNPDYKSNGEPTVEDIMQMDEEAAEVAQLNDDKAQQNLKDAIAKERALTYDKNADPKELAEARKELKTVADAAVDARSKTLASNGQTQEPAPQSIKDAKYNLSAADRAVKKAQEELFESKKYENSHDIERENEALAELIRAQKERKVMAKDLKIAENNDPIKRAKTGVEEANAAVKKAQKELFESQKYENSHDIKRKNEALAELTRTQQKRKTATKNLETVTNGGTSDTNSANSATTKNVTSTQPTIEKPTAEEAQQAVRNKMFQMWKSKNERVIAELNKNELKGFDDLKTYMKKNERLKNSNATVQSKRDLQKKVEDKALRLLDRAKHRKNIVQAEQKKALAEYKQLSSDKNSSSADQANAKTRLQITSKALAERYKMLSKAKKELKEITPNMSDKEIDKRINNFHKWHASGSR